jgi:hypothetical protein
MQDSNSYPSFPPERTNDLAEELYPDIFSGAFPDIDPGPLTYSEFYAKRNAQRNAIRTEKQPLRTEQSTTGRVKAVQSAPSPAPISLIDALQATINRHRPKKEPIVIAGEKKNQYNTDSLLSVRPAYYLSPRLRLVILFIVIVLIVLLILLFPTCLSIH